MRIGKAVRLFFSDKRGGTAERLAVFGGVVAISCVSAVHLIDIAARNGALPRYVMRGTDDELARLATTLRPGGTRQNGAAIDYSATATVAARGVTLDPCTGKSK